MNINIPYAIVTVISTRMITHKMVFFTDEKAIETYNFLVDSCVKKDEKEMGKFHNYIQIVDDMETQFFLDSYAIECITAEKLIRDKTLIDEKLEFENLDEEKWSRIVSSGIKELAKELNKVE